MAGAEELNIRDYLLRRLSEPEEQQVELRLLNDPDFAEEYDIVEREIIDDYISGKFSSEDRRMIEEHYFNSDERRAKLKFALALKRRKSELAISQKTARRSYKPYLAIAASLLLVVGGFVVWRTLTANKEVDKGLAALQSAFRQERPFESRISRLDYAPYVVTRGPGEHKVDQNELDRAELTLLQALKDRPTPAAHHALGKVFLAKKDFDKAIAEFETAATNHPKNPLLFSDLGAAWLEKGKVDRDVSPPGRALEDFAHSLQRLQQALQLNPDLLEALFNRGLVHQYMMLPAQAENDWLEYLKKDSTSGWAEEARHNLENSQRQNSSSKTKEELLRSYLDAYERRDEDAAWEVIRHSRDSFTAGKLIRDQLLDAYLQSASSNPPDAMVKFDAFQFQARVELKKTGDAYTTTLARFYEALPPKKSRTLVQARDLIKQGQAAYAHGQPRSGIDLFTRAKTLFMERGDLAEADFAEFSTGICYMNAFDTSRSVAIFEKLASSFERQKYKWLFMRALHLLSGATYNLAQYSKAIDYNRRSLALAEEMGDTIGTFNALTTLIEQYRYIGNFEQALGCVQRNLSLIYSCALNEIQVAQYYGVVAAAFSSSNLHSAAADYQNEALKRALTTGQIQTISRAYANLSSIYDKIGDYSQALSNARLAYDTAKSESDDRLRTWMIAYSSLQIGNIFRKAGDLKDAIASYNECLDLNQNLENYYGLYEAHKNRFSCYIASGNDDAARQELKTTLGLAEKYRAEILEEDNRNHFFDLEQNVYDLAIDFQYSRAGDPEKAFDFSEASRARSLLDLVNSKGSVPANQAAADVTFTSLSQPLKRQEIQARIPASGQIVQYAVLSDKLLIWLISKTRFLTLESKISQDDLTEKVFAFVNAISDRTAPATASDQGKELWELVLKPVEPYLLKEDPVYLVPDKVLNYLPFAALINPNSNEFLVQEYLTVTTPSSSLLVIASEAAKRKQKSRSERLLSVGNPSFDRAEFPGLVNLPSAEAEAGEVARFYPNHSLLIRDLARKQRVQSEMERSDVIHFAVHSFFDQHSPFRSKLVLAKPATNETESGVLEANEIYRMHLSQPRLVVLSACQSGVERYYGGEGMFSLTRPFLAAGVPLVIASLWAVDSEATAQLMISFHKHRKQDNMSSAAALRQAQLEMLASPDQHLHQPYFWSAFIAVGGITTF